MLNEVRIFYWGPPGAGRAASIGSMLTEPSQTVYGDQDHQVELPSGPVILRYSGFESKYSYSIGGTARPPGFEPVLKGLAEASGIIFVVDSQSARRGSNSGSLMRLRANLQCVGRDVDELPVVFQLNKRDLPHIDDVAALRLEVCTRWCSYVESVASKGVGTVEAIMALLLLIAEGHPRG